MSETRFTPGPWGVFYDHAGGIFVGARTRYTAGGSYAQQLATVHAPIASPGYETEAIGSAEANAHLMAAAPRMAEYIKARADAGDPEALAIWNEATMARGEDA